MKIYLVKGRNVEPGDIGVSVPRMCVVFFFLVRGCCVWEREPRLLEKGAGSRRAMTAIFAGRVTGELHQRTPVRARCNQPEAALRHLGASLGFGAAKPRLDGSCQIPSLIFFGRTWVPKGQMAATRPVIREIAVPGQAEARFSTFHCCCNLACNRFRDNDATLDIHTQQFKTYVCFTGDADACCADEACSGSPACTLYANNSRRLVPAHSSSKFRRGTARDLTPIPAIGARLSRPVRARG